jgi:citrate lyase gamma subunit
MSTHLALSGIDRPQVMISPEAHEAKRVALQIASSVQEIVDAQSQSAATQALATVKALAAQVEASRKAIKEPVIKAGRDIDAAASQFVADLESEARRLSLMVGAFADAERRKAAALAEEARRKEREVLEATKAEERARMAREVTGRTGTLSADLQAIQAKAITQVAAVRQNAAAATVAPPPATQVRTSWKFEVLDVNALYRAHPDLCTIVPNNAAIRAILPHRKTIAGVRVWSESAAIVSAKAPTATPTSVAAYDY